MIIGNVILDHVEGTRGQFKVVQGFQYQDNEYFVDVKPGWITDGASTPRFIWWLFPPIAGKYLEAAVLHDALYRSQIFTRKESDLIFKRAMEDIHVQVEHIFLIYYSVRWFGKKAWEENKSKIKEYRKYISGYRYKDIQNEIKDGM